MVVSQVKNTIQGSRKNFWLEKGANLKKTPLSSSIVGFINCTSQKKSEQKLVNTKKVININLVSKISISVAKSRKDLKKSYHFQSMSEASVANLSNEPWNVPLGFVLVT